ncbi:MAG: SCO family protein [Bacteroidetes bacterium]|nr:SCO family protein [Bacteroidota bacterium]
MSNKNKFYWLLLLLPAIFIAAYAYNVKNKKALATLPYFGPKNKKQATDSVKHQINNFSFVNQDNQVITKNNIKEKIVVVEFFFTTCKTICPIMNNNLSKVYNVYKTKKDFLILSHTVDPEFDSVPQLLNYAKERNANTKNWMFLTGKKVDLYNMARKSYLLDNTLGNGDEDDFVHTQNFALLDKNLYIRGFYDGTDSLEIDRLIKEINLLYKEYEP